MTTHRDNDNEAPDRIAFVTYRDDEEPQRPTPPTLDRQRIELFRRAYDPKAREKPPEREKRIKFEVVDDSPLSQKKRSGFNPYESSVAPKKIPPRR